MAGRHQVAATVLTSPDQVTRGLLRGGRDRHRCDLIESQQPGQMDRVLGISLDPITRGLLCSLLGAATSQRIPAAVSDR